MKKIFIIACCILIIPFNAIANDSIVLGLKWGDTYEIVKSNLQKRFGAINVDHDEENKSVIIKSQTQVKGLEYRVYCTVTDDSLCYIEIICNVNYQGRNNPRIASSLAREFFSNYFDCNNSYKLIYEELYLDDKYKSILREYISNSTHVSISGGGNKRLEGTNICLFSTHSKLL